MRRHIAAVRAEDDENEINLTPMLDVVFIMLIFFIVTASFVKETGLDVNRPSASTAEQKTAASILVAIGENNEVWIDKRMVDVRAVSANIKRMLADNPKGSVVVQADKNSKNGVLVQVLDQAKIAGATNVAVSATPD
jgi:biopolymer transport protein ExbD